MRSVARTPILEPYVEFESAARPGDTRIEIKSYGDSRSDIQLPTDAYHEGDAQMTGWTSDELTKIGTANELEIASLRRDGTLRHATTIWVVRLGDDLFVRSVNGRTAAWFRGTQVRHEGRIRAGGVEKDVAFVDADDDTGDQIDDAYRNKYRRYAPSIVGSVLTPEARSATIKLVPRSTSSS